jgi:head-tail adaptor
MRAVAPGALDHHITFYAPSASKDAIGDVVNSLSIQGTTRAQRIFKNSSERIEAQQQVGNIMEDFRIRDRMFSVTHTWEMDVYCITDPSDVKRYKVRGIQKEGRGNSVLITAEYKDNG